MIAKLFAGWQTALAAAGIAVLALAGAYLYGRFDEARRCESAALTARIATLERDLAIARDAERTARAQAEELERENDDAQSRYADLLTELEARPVDDRCRATADDVRLFERLRAPPRPPARP